MNTSTLNSIDNSMDQQLRVLEKLENLIEDCDDRMTYGEAKEADVQHLREYCADMRRAAETAKALAKAIAPVYKEEDDKRKAEDEKKKKDEAAAKRSEAAKKAAATRKAAEAKKKAEEEPAPADEEEDDDFLD